MARNKFPVEKKHLYFHPNSQEPGTNRKKNKYKLLTGCGQLDIYTFIVGTSKPYGNQKRTIVTEYDDWIDITSKGSHSFKLKQRKSYFCWDNCDVHKKPEITRKFEHIAYLRQQKFEELLEKKSNVQCNANRNSPRKERLRHVAISEDRLISKEARKLGLI